MRLEITFDWKADGDEGLISQIPMGRRKAYTAHIELTSRNRPRYNDLHTASIFGGDGKLIKDGSFGYMELPDAMSMVQPVEDWVRKTLNAERGEP